VQRLPRITESAPISDVLHDIHKRAREGMEILDIPRHKPRPSEILEELDEFVFQWRKGYRPEESALLPENLPMTMGSLWGEVLVARFKWEWVKLMFHEHGNSVAHGVVAPDRSLAVFPIHFLIGCLRNPNVDVTIMLAYNLLKAGKVGQLTPFSYFNLMDGVHRIVPRE